MLHLQEIDQQDSYPCCSMSIKELSREDEICHSCIVQLEAEAEDMALELGRDNYYYMRYGDE